MTALLAVLLLLLAGVLLIMMVVQAARGISDLFTVRNFFLLGFILFQLTSPAMSLWTDRYDTLKVYDQPRAAVIYCLLTVLFLALFLFITARRQLVHAIALRFGANTGSPGPGSMLTLAAVFLGLGILAKAILVQIPYLGIIADAMGSGILIVTVAMAAWAAAPRMLNPAVTLPAALLITASVLTTLSLSAFSRRDVVALVVAMAWGAYHGYWKYMGLKATLARGAVVFFLGLLLFGAFTVTRSYEKLTSTPGALLGRLTSANPFQGLYELGTGQFAGANSMWIIQTRPDVIPYDTLHTARYVLAHPIPRAVWPDKPGALGQTLTKQGRVRNVSKGTSLGPGLIGHIYNDNPWLAFLPYTIVLALFISFLDELIRVRPWNPFVVLPIVVALGEIVAFPRGELGLFFVRAVAYLAGSWILLNATAATLRMVGWLPRVDPEPEPWLRTVEWTDAEPAIDPAAQPQAGR
jgi:hypothetical protein